MILHSTLRKLQAADKAVWRVDQAAYTATVGHWRHEVIASISYFASAEGAKNYAESQDGTMFGATSKPTITKIAAKSLDLSTFW